MTSLSDKAQKLTLMLVAVRNPDATICPSEVARQLAADQESENWREFMPTIHAAVDALAAEGRIGLSWKGKMLASRAGAYRIGRTDGAGRTQA